MVIVDEMILPFMDDFEHMTTIKIERNEDD